MVKIQIAKVDKHVILNALDDVKTLLSTIHILTMLFTRLDIIQTEVHGWKIYMINTENCVRVLAGKKNYSVTLSSLAHSRALNAYYIEIILKAINEIESFNEIGRLFDIDNHKIGVIIYSEADNISLNISVYSSKEGNLLAHLNLTISFRKRR